MWCSVIRQNVTDVSEESIASTSLHLLALPDLSRPISEPGSPPTVRSICFLLVASLAYSCILKTEAVRASETPVNFYQTTRSHIPQDNTIQANLYFQI
jgi:hypothetical protein